jgi:Ca2+/Na+ antiporter
LCIPAVVSKYHTTIDFTISKETAILILAVTLLLSKLIKPFPHFWRNPRDIIWIPGYILFGYYAGFIKLKALVTAYNVSWGTRPGVK